LDWERVKRKWLWRGKKGGRQLPCARVLPLIGFSHSCLRGHPRDVYQRGESGELKSMIIKRDTLNRGLLGIGHTGEKRGGGNQARCLELVGKKNYRRMRTRLPRPFITQGATTRQGEGAKNTLYTERETNLLSKKGQKKWKRLCGPRRKKEIQMAKGIPLTPPRTIC